MFLRQRSINDVHYWSLVCSFRDNGKPRQKTILSLGNTNNAILTLKSKKEFAPYLKQIRAFKMTKKYNNMAYNYFVYTGASTAEEDVIKKLKPERLLLSYFYFKNKPLDQVIQKLGYAPEILLDSGAFSAYMRGKNIAIVDYIKYIKENVDYVKNYISLDVIGDSHITFSYYQIMLQQDLKPIPVYHYGESEEHLKKYIQEKYIALGGTVPITDKKVVADWVNYLIGQYPDVKFHLLGSSSKSIINSCNIYSYDSSTWMMAAINGRVPHIKGNSREDKIKRAEYLMGEQMLITGRGV